MGLCRHGTKVHSSRRECIGAYSTAETKPVCEEYAQTTGKWLISSRVELQATCVRAMLLVDGWLLSLLASITNLTNRG